MATATPTLDAVATTMLASLSPFLPASVVGLPIPTVIMVSLRERSAGIGGRIGMDTIAGVGIIALKGIRLEGVARFQLWADAPAGVDAAIAALNASILVSRDTLRANGFVTISLKAARPAQSIVDVGWRRYADYRVLFEFPYLDSDDAESIIARIPIAIDSDFNESTVVTDGMTRWDEVAAPSLAVRGRLGVTALSALSFVPGALPTGIVTVLRTFDGAQAPPAVHANIAGFLTAVGGGAPAETHASITFASVNAFLAALGPATGSITLGDWDQNAVPDVYTSRTLDIEPPIELAGVADRFEITYDAPPFDHVAALYLRLSRSVTIRT